MTRIWKTAMIVGCFAFMVSCKPQGPEITDVAAKFLEMLEQDHISGNLSTEMLFLLEPESYDDWDMFYSDLPAKRDKHYPVNIAGVYEEYYQFAPISVMHIDTIDSCSYKVKLKIGKKAKTISLKVSENNKLITQLHGTGIPGRFHFSNLDGNLYLYRTPTEKQAYERYRNKFFIDGTEYYEEHISSSDNKGRGNFYILKKKGKVRSQIAYCSYKNPPEICWVENKYLDRDEQYRAPYELSWKDYARDILSIPVILMLPFLAMGVAGGGVAAAGDCIVIIF